MAGAAGLGVVGDGHGDGGAVGDEEGAVFVEVFPAVVAVFGFAVGGGDAGFGAGAPASAGPVSYTHLTMPTKRIG